MSNSLWGLAAAALTATAALVGVGITQWSQRQASDRAARDARGKALRDERLKAAADLAGAVTDHRRALLELWLEGTSDYRRTRSLAWHALYRVRLLMDDADVLDAADATLRSAAAIRDAENQQAAESEAARTREMVQAFITVTRDRVTLSD